MSPHSTGLQPLDYLVVLVYLAAVLLTGWYFSREQKEGDDYFVAGRQMPWLAVGLSIVATLLSTVTYLAFPGELIQHGLAMCIGWLSLPIAFVIINFLWIPFIMRLGVTSIYEYLQMRFGLTARWMAVVLFVFILRMLWMATIVLTASRAVAQITFDSVPGVVYWAPTPDQWTLVLLLAVGLLATVYTMLGGIKAVIWTDVAQFIALFAGIVLTLIFVAIRTGTGPIEWLQTTVQGAGHEFPPLASWDITVRNTILFTTLNAIFWYSCTFIADQVAVQRYLTTSSVEAAVRGNIVNFFGDWIVMMLLALCGMALLTYYLDPQYQTEIVKGISDPRHPDAADHTFPHFIAHGLPVGVSGLVVAALFAVAMSSLDSGMNSVSAVITIDVFKRLRPDCSARSELKLARVITLVTGIVCTAVALLMFNIPENYNIIGLTARTFNCALGPLGGLFVAGMFLPHVSEKAAVIGTSFGLAVALTTAWWAEAMWWLGLTDFTALAAAVDEISGPSPFLITPISATSTVFTAGAFGWLFPEVDRERATRTSWRGVVRGIEA